VKTMRQSYAAELWRSGLPVTSLPDDAWRTLWAAKQQSSRPCDDARAVCTPGIRLGPSPGTTEAESSHSIQLTGAAAQDGPKMAKIRLCASLLSHGPIVRELI
jgi:hypothetical protein